MLSLRTILERSLRGRTLTRRLPPNFSRLPLIVSPDAQLKYIRPGKAGFDQALLEAAPLLVRPAHNVWDIGANVGVFTVASAALSRTGQFVAVEADIWLAEMIRRTARLRENAGFSIHVIPAAAFSALGIEMFSIAARGRASSHLTSVPGTTQSGGARHEVPVPTLPLDLLLQHFLPPNLVKIDVEGAEVETLMGMFRLLSEVRPDVFIEIADENREAVADIMRKYEYHRVDLATRRPTQEQAVNALYTPVEPH